MDVTQCVTMRHNDPPWPNAIEIPEGVWEAYQQFRDAEYLWHRIMGCLDNDTYEEQQAGWTKYLQPTNHEFQAAYGNRFYCHLCGLHKDEHPSVVP